MQKSKSNPCPPKPPVQERPLLTEIQADQLEELFKVLAGGTRLRILHAIIRSGEICVSDLAEAIGMTSQAVSNQLQRLFALGIVASRRDGNNIFYRIVDPCVTDLLDRGLCLLEDTGPLGRSWVSISRSQSEANVAVP